MTAMRLLYKIKRNYEPYSSWKIIKEMLWGCQVNLPTVNFMLFTPDSHQGPSSENVSVLYSQIITRLASNHLLRFYFPTHRKEVIKCIKDIKAQYHEQNKWVWMDVFPSDVFTIKNLFDKLGFTQFFAEIDGIDKIPEKVDDLFCNITHSYSLISFELYDDSIEIISSVLSPEEIINIANDVCIDRGISITAQS